MNARHRAEVELEVEAAPLPREVLVELAARVLDAPRGAENARAADAREPVEIVGWIGVEPDRGDTSIGGGDEELADRRLDDVVADVDEPERRGCLAEAAVEVGGDGHEVILLRMRRTPVDVACRAASGLEPSTDAIWSYERS